MRIFFELIQVQSGCKCLLILWLVFARNLISSSNHKVQAKTARFRNQILCSFITSLSFHHRDTHDSYIKIS